MEQEIDPKREALIKGARKSGLALISLAAALAYVSTYTPIHEASHGAATVRVSNIAVLFTVFFAVFGSGLLIGGGRFVEAIMPLPGKRGFTKYLVIILTLAVTAGLCFGFFYYLGTLGYSFF